jgi:uncharacterized damage-inducible protein DinB
MFTSMKALETTWKMEQETTRRVLAALPDSGLGYRPHAKSRTASELAWHVATSPLWFVAECLKLPARADVPKNAPAKAAEFAQTYDRVARACSQALQGKNDAWLAQTADFIGQKLPIGQILGLTILHEVHHRGQLSTYLRNVGAKVPSIYGPSGDEGMEETPPPKPKKKAAASGKRK